MGHHHEMLIRLRTEFGNHLAKLSKAKRDSDRRYWLSSLVECLDRIEQVERAIRDDKARR